MTLTPWDPDRPVLGALITEMYARENISFAANDHGVAFTNTNSHGRPVRDITIPHLLVDGVRLPVSFDALVSEQINDDELFVSALSGRPTQYRASIPAHLAPPDVNRPQSRRTRELTVTVFWENQRTIIIHRQLFINGVPDSAKTAASYQNLVDLNTPHTQRSAAYDGAMGSNATT